MNKDPSMNVYYDINDLPTFKNAVITIGSFDGVHRGHQKILTRINELAKETDGESILVTFHPHPRKIIFPKDKSLSLLTTLDEKLELCRIYGVDNVVVVPFSIEFSRQSPREYIEDFLVKSFNPRYIVIGYDHKYGLNREGDIYLLKSYEEKLGFKVLEIAKQELEDIAISSSKIRKALLEGDVRTAHLYRGSTYTLAGTVVHGQKLGQTIGYPTANIQLTDKDKLVPMDGVYVVRCDINGLKKNGMMYIGRRPTVESKDTHRSIEVNIFDFQDTIYNEPIQVELIERIRGSEKFDDVDQLKSQLALDREASIEILSSITPSPEISSIDKVCIAILNYNGEQYLESYLPSVLHSASSLINIAVIDNNSTDESVPYLEEWHPEVRVIQLTKNYGFAEGYNRGLKEIKAKYYVLLNSDVQVKEGWLDPILQLMDNSPEIAACQPKILSLEEKSYFEYAGASGGYMDVLGYPYCRGRIFDTVEKDTGQYDDMKEVDWVSGAAMVVRSDIYHQLGGLDNDYFAHMEEIDLCWRIQRAGYSMKVVPESVVYHLGGGTLDYGNARKTYLNFRNNLATIVKNNSFGRLLWLFPLRLLLDGVAGLKFLASGNLASMMAIVKAHFSIYGSMGHIVRKKAYYDRIIRKYHTGKRTKSKKVFSVLLKYYLASKKNYNQL